MPELATKRQNQPGLSSPKDTTSALTPKLSSPPTIHHSIDSPYPFLLLPLAPDAAPAAPTTLNISSTLTPLDPVASVTFPRPISSTILFGSAAPITGTLLASHCWNGFATK